MSENSVLYEIDSRGVARVTLNRPDLRNAMNEVLIADLLKTLEQVAADDSARFMVITGNGKGFCAGGDLNWMRRTADYDFQKNYDDALVLGRLMRKLFEMPKPTLALVNGAAFGGGMGLVAGCDIAIAAEEAKFSLSEVKLGLLPATIAPTWSAPWVSAIPAGISSAPRYLAARRPTTWALSMRWSQGQSSRRPARQ